MEIFEIVNGEVVVTKECLLIPQFKAIWTRDKDKNKKRAYKEFNYMYFSTNWKSIYLSYDTKTREEKLLQDFIGDTKWKPDPVLLTAIEKYKEFQNTPSMRFLLANREAIESMSDYFSGIDWNMVNDKGTPIYKITEVSRAAKEASGILDSLGKLEDKVKKELAMADVKARGNSIGGALEFL